MKIKMLKTREGSPDGISVVTYCADDIIDMPDELAKVFLRKRWAKKNETKNLGKAPENKRAKTRKILVKK
ncbi:hypothetical protein JYT29_01130 [Nitrospina gracilis]|nr:hypothetical protein [Nitrospinaceae bacterium]MBN4077912.1 hypothetical protein [Nitrospina gracilis]